MTEVEKKEWGRLMCSTSGRRILQQGALSTEDILKMTPEAQSVESEKGYNAMRLDMFWKRMRRLTTEAPVPYVACDVSNDPIQRPGVTSYVVLEHRQMKCAIVEFGDLQAGTATAEFHALVQSCARADRESVVVSDHVVQLKYNKEAREKVVTLTQEKKLKLYGRPSWDPHWPDPPGDPFLTLRQRLYSLAHGAARMINLKLITQNDLFV